MISLCKRSSDIFVTVLYLPTLRRTAEVTSAYLNSSRRLDLPSGFDSFWPHEGWCSANNVWHSLVWWDSDVFLSFPFTLYIHSFLCVSHFTSVAWFLFSFYDQVLTPLQESEYVNILFSFLHHTQRHTHVMFFFGYRTPRAARFPASATLLPTRSGMVLHSHHTTALDSYGGD